MKRLKVSRNYILILVDVILINLSYILAYCFRFNFHIPNYELERYMHNAIIITLIYLIMFYLFKLYKNLWSYASINEFLFIVYASVASGTLAICYGFAMKNRLPISVNILAALLSILLVGGFRMSSRIIGRYLVLKSKAANGSAKRVMIIGAGSAGTIIAKEMKFCTEVNYLPVAFIDDDKYKIGTYVAGVKVKGTREDIIKVAKELNVDEILIAIAAIDAKNKKEIIDICKETSCKVKLIPGIYEIIDGKVTLNKIRDVSYEDLLGREPVKLNMNGIEGYIKDRVVLVTGGGGSIGSELCRQIAKFNPKEVIVLDNYENGVYDLQSEFKYKKIKINLKAVIASITDKKRLESVFIKYKPEIVFHAAAHKHVPLMEGNPVESVKNNIFGTLNLVKYTDKYNVKKFVMISTDKAVNPTNIMGATKRACEMIVQSMDKKSKTEFVSVRFGNVLGSNGSVIPLFKKQIAHGGPVTVTHPEINRFFMTIPEAAQLVLQAGVFAKGGEIFVLDMESPIKIYDLAYDMIKLSGFEPNVDIKIEFIGLRPGEKLYEEVLTEEEGLTKTSHNKIFVGKATYENFDELMLNLNELQCVAENDDAEGVINKMTEIVTTYTPSYTNITKNQVAAEEEINIG